MFGIAFGRREYSVCEVEESAIALRLAGNVMMIAGMLITCIDIIVVLWDAFRMRADFGFDGYLISFAISFIGLVYGLAAKQLLPFQSRLEVVAARLRDSGQEKGK